MANDKLPQLGGSGGFSEGTGTDSHALAELITDQVLRACLVPGHDRGTLNQAVLDFLDELRPANPLQGMLAGQIVACHFLALSQMGKAAQAPDLKSQAAHLQLATKLQRTFNTQLETWMKLRGQQQQKVLVEHVHVHEGGQAIVGNVVSGRGAA